MATIKPAPSIADLIRALQKVDPARGLVAGKEER
jgi:hypothetical protein